MGLFKDVLKDSESIFLNPISLDYDYQPKLVPYRENHQNYMASSIKPLFQNRNGKNLFIFGQPGIGKTVSTRHVLRELEEYEDSIYLIYINCWKFDTSFRVVNEICDQINYKFTHNKRTDELMKVIESYFNKKSSVIVLDEVDKLKDFDALYSILEGIHRKTMFLITNGKDWLINLDQRLRSRLNAEDLEFKPYNKEETFGILNQRLDFAFVPGSFDKDAFNLIAEKCYEIGDIRTGLFLLKESGELAEQESSKKVTIDHSNSVIDKLKNFKIRNANELEEEEIEIFNIIKENSGRKIKEIYDIYKNNGGDKAYSTFHRKINDLKANKLIETEENSLGEGGKSYTVKYIKKLDEF